MADRNKEELVPATQASKVDAEDSQESVDHVPESPPIYTQDDEEEEEARTSNKEEDDVEAQLSRSDVVERKLSNVSAIRYDDESAPGGGMRGAGTGTDKGVKANFDVVIDMECVDDEPENAIQESKNDATADEFDMGEFPEEDDDLLMSAASTAEDRGMGVDQDREREPEGVEEELYEQIDTVSRTLELDTELKALEDANKAAFSSFKRFKPGEKIFPDVRCSDHNTITFKLKPSFTVNDVLEPFPRKFIPKWESKTVPMPCCSEHHVLVRNRRKPNPQDGNSDNNNEDTSGLSEIRKVHVWQRIIDTFSSLSIMCSEDLGTTIRNYCFRLPELTALQYCVEQIMEDDVRDHFFSTVIPFMKDLVLQLPEIVTCPLPILRKNVNHNISLSQKQVACLLANAFFSTFPKRFNFEADMPSINFKELFAGDINDERRLIMKAQKIRCLINYFSRITDEMPRGVVTYTRKNLRHSTMPDWANIDKGLSNFVPLIEGTIEDDGAGMLQVDFANRFIGGGVLGQGAVQEEILFVIYPELILTRLFTEKLNFSEAVIITGCERFSKYRGYSVNFTFDGDYRDQTPYDSKGRRCTQIVAIDALYISRPTFQFHPRHITRELNKAFVGFCSPSTNSVAVATGKWGCGAFNGDPQLKAIIQLLAASHAGRDLAFFTFGDIGCFKDVTAIYESIRRMKIKEVWHLLCQYHKLCCTTNKVSRSLKDFARMYADGANYQQLQDAKQVPSSSKQSKGNSSYPPITNFYQPITKRTTLDDEYVADITNGINKINSANQHKSPTNVSGGKRQREEVEPKNLSEEQIQNIIQEENSQLLVVHTEEPTKEAENTTASNDVVSPKSPKRAKRLEDFYLSNNENG